MARYAIVENGKVVNIAEADADLANAKGWLLINGNGTATIGDLYDGVQFTKVQPPLSDIRKLQLAKIDAAYDIARQANIDYMGTTFEAIDSIQLLLLKQFVVGTVPPGFYILDINNVKVSMTFVQMKGLGQLIFAQNIQTYINRAEKRALINAAVTNADILAINW